MPPHLLRCQGLAVNDYSFTLGRLEAGVPSTFAQLGYELILNFYQMGSFSIPQGLDPISAKLFCKHSQLIFMSYKVVLKDERRTSNIERPTSNEKQTSNTEHSTPISVSFQPF